MPKEEKKSSAVVALEKIASMLESSGLPTKPTLKEAKVTVTRTKTKSKGGVKTTLSDEQVSEKIKVKLFITSPAYVTVKLGETIGGPPGSFSSERIDVGVSIPCYMEEIEEVYCDAIEFCRKRIKQETGDEVPEDDFDEEE